MVGDAAASEKYDDEEDQPETLLDAATDPPVADAEELDEVIVGALVDRCLGGDPPDDPVGDHDDAASAQPSAATPGPVTCGALETR